MESRDGGSEKYNLSTGISQRGERDMAVFSRSRGSFIFHLRRSFRRSLAASPAHKPKSQAC
jgi:hypothetical protein